MKINFRLAEKQGSTIDALAFALQHSSHEKRQVVIAAEGSKHTSSHCSSSSHENHYLPETTFKFNYNKPKTPSAESILEELK